MSQLYFFSSEVHFPKCTWLTHVSFTSLSKYQTWIISNKDFFVIEIISTFLVFFSALLPPCPPISDPPPWGWPEDLFMTSFMRPVIVARNWRDTIDLSPTKEEENIFKMVLENWFRINIIISKHDWSLHDTLLF